MARAASAILGLVLGALMALAACAPAPEGGAPEPAYIAEGRPQSLDAWGQIARRGGQLVLGEGVTAYELNTALFSDHAVKLRTVWMPDGAGPAQYHERAVFEFPAGTVITKTFFYPLAGGGFDQVSDAGVLSDHFDGAALDLTGLRLIETRVLVRREAGWEALPYLWDDAQTGASLARTGAMLDLTLISAAGSARDFPYAVPDVNQCAACHVTDARDGAVRPIGPAARHLNRDFLYAHGSANQIAHWSETGLLTGAPEPDAAPRAARWHGQANLSGLQLERAARAYIDINCAHCHSRTGPARTSGLYLEPWEPDGPNLGRCKPPIAAGRGTGGRLHSIVPGDSDRSIFVYRMETERVGAMMPELGRAVADGPGVALIAAWIDAMAGGCG
ncbi:hypothetical protein F1654_07805 [Alkalicaulis satelles]|uniref:Cytochrome c domain-containing protein n=1 Tax=Alkalicaulis satelles TaxID=2609175 RepID=A0A5M6ZJ31_9PROT|nr:SO2930 family diheme c-type cytochrome [Alkalicaulis satelles]KAA5803697.1 hypothetical protein F1654_07805 [Alkalicaulis satelles]